MSCAFVWCETTSRRAAFYLFYWRTEPYLLYSPHTTHQPAHPRMVSLFDFHRPGRFWEPRTRNNWCRRVSFQPQKLTRAANKRRREGRRPRTSRVLGPGSDDHASDGVRQGKETPASHLSISFPERLPRQSGFYRCIKRLRVVYDTNPPPFPYVLTTTLPPLVWYRTPCEGLYFSFRTCRVSTLIPETPTPDTEKLQ